MKKMEKSPSTSITLLLQALICLSTVSRVVSIGSFSNNGDGATATSDSSLRARIVVDELDYWDEDTTISRQRQLLQQGRSSLNLDGEVDPFLPGSPLSGGERNIRSSSAPTSIDNDPESLRLQLFNDNAIDDDEESGSYFNDPTVSTSSSSLMSHFDRQKEFYKKYMNEDEIPDESHHPTYQRHEFEYQYRPRSTETSNTAMSSSSVDSKSSLKHTKTGTTIAGCVVRLVNSTNKSLLPDGEYVILGADTRATESTMVADPNCEKIHCVASNIYCCGAGTSADCDHVTRQCLFSMALQSLVYQQYNEGMKPGNQNSTATFVSPQKQFTSSSDDDDYDDDDKLIISHQVSIEQACTWLQDVLFQYGGGLGVNLILGGVYNGKGELRALHPHGSIDRNLPFAALGSGGWAAMSVLEQGYAKLLQINADDDENVKKNKSVASTKVNATTSTTASNGNSIVHENIATVSNLDDAIQLVTRAIRSGIQNDLGSGSNVDLCIIKPDGTSQYKRHVIPEDELVLPPKASSSSETGKENVDKDEKESGSIDDELGVNGFGNLPFAISSRRVLRPGYAQSQQQVNTKLDQLFFGKNGQSRTGNDGATP